MSVTYYLTDKPYLSTHEKPIPMSNNIKIRVTEDSMGCLHLTPIKESYIDQIINYLKEFNVESDGSVLIQSDYDVESFYEDCSYRQRKDVQSGWGATMLFDAWTFLTYIGYDADTGLELK